jgi:O-antigen/teichoic acid export membrane protein
MMITLQIASLGFPLSLLYNSQRNPNNGPMYLVNTVFAMLFVGCIGGIILTVFVRSKTDYFGVVPWFVLIGLVAYVPVHLQGFVARSVLLREIQARKISLMRILSVAGSFIPVVVFSVLGILSVPLAIVCVFFATLMMTIAGWSCAWPALDFSERPSFQVFCKLFSVGIRMSWGDMMILLNSQVGVLITKHLIEDFESVGYFSRGQRIATLVLLAGQAITPLLFSKWASLSDDKVASQVEKVMRFASAVVAVAIITIVLTGKWIILLLYGKEFLPAVRPMMILLPGAALYLLCKAFISLLSSRGRPEIAALFLTAAVLINVAISWYLIPIAGISGAAWASTISNVALFVGLMFTARKKFGIRIAQCLLLTRNDIRSIAYALLKYNA